MRLKSLLIITILFFAANAWAKPNYPERIVSLKPNITELLFAIGAGDKVVGVTTWCDKPESAQHLPKVADYIRPNLEKIIALKPEIVVGSEENSMSRPIKLLERAGITILILPFNKVEDLFSSTLKLAEATGHERGGQKLVEKMRSPLTLNPSPQGGEGKTTTLIIVGKRPLIAAGRSAFLGELIKISGGKNIVGGRLPYPHINMETILAKDPDVIIDLSMGSEEDDLKKIYGYWKKYPLKAVRNKRIHALNISDFRIGPGLPDQIEKLNKLLLFERTE